MSDDETAARRLTVCRQCEHNRRGRCRKAGRHVQVLARDPEAGCPAQKWPGEAADADPPHATETNAADVDERPQQPTPAQPSRSDWQIIIKSFKRFAPLRRLVESIRRHHPDVPVLVADDSFERPPARWPADLQAVAQTPNVEVRSLPFNVGLSAGRNSLMRAATAEYVVTFDDDYVVTEETRIDNLLRVVRETEIDVCCGLTREDGRTAMNWGGHFRFEDAGPHETRRLVVDPLASPWRSVGGVRFRRTDLGWNFFAARRQTLLDHPWDEQYPIIGEHLDHFLELHAAGVPVAYTPDAIVGHLNWKTAEYKPYRWRCGQMQKVCAKWNIARPPEHARYEEPGVAPRSAQSLLLREKGGDKPNVVVLGVGHSGTSVACGLLAALGWNLGPAASDRWREHPGVRSIVRAGEFRSDEAACALDALPRPWALKEPMLLRVIDDWLGHFAPHRPLLLWVTRDLDAVRESYRRRGEGVPVEGDVLFHGWTLAQMHARCAEIFRDWPWQKLHVRYEQLRAAAGLFKLDPTAGGDGLV